MTAVAISAIVAATGALGSTTARTGARDGDRPGLVRVTQRTVDVPPSPAVPPTTVPAPPAAAVAPEPVDPPADPRAPEPLVVLGTIEIPRLGLAAPLHQGISLTSIDRGPSHWPGTALPGEVGNAVVAGHRVTKTRPFRHIDSLVPGDLVHFTVDGRRSTYEVTGHEVVTPKGFHILDQTPTATATLFACHPPGSARYRYVVRLALVDDATA